MHNEIDLTRGPADRARVEDALAWIDVHIAPLPAEDVPLADAAGRIPADKVRAAVDVPPFDRATVDGFAVRADETVGAGAYNPLPFRSGSAADDLRAGAAVRVNSGDPLPRGADAVVVPEQFADGAEEPGALIAAVAAGTFIERQGSQAARGSSVVSAGVRLRPGHIGLLAAAGVARVAVVRRPRVYSLLVGRNVAAAGTPPSRGVVLDADGPLLRALTARDGGLLMDQRWVDRSMAAIRSALALSGADIILLAGGTGRGPDDYAAAALAEAGELAVHGVALRPGDTAGIGRTAAGVPVVLLPGPPAACLWAYEFFAGRAMRRLGGRNPALPFRRHQMTAARKIVSELGTMEVCPVQCSGDGTAVPIAAFAESGLTAATRADGFVLVPEASEGYPQGAAITVYLYEDNDPTPS